MLQSIDRRLLTILLIVFVQILGASLILPILPLYAQREFSMTPQTITLLVTAYFAAQFVAGPYLGRLSDRYGRLPVLIVSQIGTALSFLMLALAPSVTFLFLARLLDGITGGNIIVARAYIIDITERERRTQAFGYLFAAFGLGFILGPALGGLLSAAFGARIPYIIAAIAATLVVGLTWLILDETLSQAERTRNKQSQDDSLALSQIVRNQRLVQVLTIVFIGQFGFGLLQSTFALFGDAVLFDGFSEQATALGIGLLLASVGLTQVITQMLLLPRLLTHLGEIKIIIFGSVTRAAGMAGLALVASPYLATLPTVLFALGQGSMMPSLQTLSADSVSDELRGGVMGVYQSTINLAIIFSTAIAGFIFAVRPTVPYWVGAVLSLLAVIPTWRLLRAARRGAGADGAIALAPPAKQ